MKNEKIKITVLVILHLLIFNLFFTYRFSPAESLDTLKTWHREHRLAKSSDYLKLFLSNITDETYYYEWSTLILGKKFEDNYPFQERKRALMARFFFLEPALRMPYRDIPFEYPPLMAVPVLAAKLFTETSLGFFHVLCGILSLFYLGTLAFCEKIRRKMKLPLTSSKLLLFSLLSIFALGQIFATRLDIIPTFFYAMAIWALLEEKSFWGAFAIFMGFFAKGFSIILLPVFAIVWVARQKYLSLAITAIAFTLITLVTMYLLQDMSGGTYLQSFRYHAERGIQIESLYALLPWWMFLGQTQAVCIYEAHGCINISIHANQWILFLSKILPLAFFAGVYAALFRQRKYFDAKILFQASFLLVLCFLLSFKVFSPQFLIWLIPLVFLNPFGERKVFLFAWFLILIATQVIYPHCYSELSENTKPWIILLLSLRNLLLLGIALAVLVSWKKQATKLKLQSFT